MSSVFVETRREFLRRHQNPDGGWGYLPRKKSWLEPTAYAMLALHGDPASSGFFDRAWRLMRAWQLPDGGWKPNAVAAEAHWSTSLCVTLHCLRNTHDDAFRRGVAWLLRQHGSENDLLFRIAHRMRPNVVDLDPSLKAWPWQPGTSAWIEPTAHAVVALRHAAPAYSEGNLADRIAQGEKMILSRRCADGGWNYGNHKVLGHTLPSYPETTAVAIYGLRGNSSVDLSEATALARQMASQTKSRLAKAWLSVVLKTTLEPEPVDDVLVMALEAIGASA